MRHHKFLAILAGMILGVGALAAAQEGYYGQQAANQPAQHADSGSRLVACACPHMHSAASLTAPACATKGAPETASKQEKATKHIHSAPLPACSSQQEGNPGAPQNHVEYGG